MRTREKKQVVDAVEKLFKKKERERVRETAVGKRMINLILILIKF